MLVRDAGYCVLDPISVVECIGAGFHHGYYGAPAPAVKQDVVTGEPLAVEPRRL